MSSSYRRDYRGGEQDFFWTLPRLALAAVGVIVSVFLILVVVTPLTIGFGWVSGEANLRSFNHVRATYQEGYDDVAALQETSGNICLAVQALADAKAAGVQATIDQRETQLLAYENTFNRVRAEYSAYMSDHFRGKLIHPKDLPLPYPPLDEIRAGC